MVDTRMHGVPAASAVEARAGALQPPAITVDLRGFAEVLWRRRAWIVTTMALFFGTAALLLLVMTPRYNATAQVLIDAFGLQVLQNELTTKPTQSDSFLTDIESQVQVIVSDGVLTKVIERENLAADPEFGAAPAGLVANIAAFLGLERDKPDPAQKALQILQKRVDARRLDKTSVIDVSAWSKDPRKAAHIANAITTVYFEGQAEARAEAARRAGATLLAGLDKLRERAERSEAAVEDYKARHAIVGANGRLVNEQQLSEMTTELTAARRRTSEQRARYSEIQRLRQNQTNPDSVTEIGSSPTYAALRARYAAAKEAQANALATYGPRHPLIQAASAQVEQLRGLLDGEIARIERTALTDLNRANDNEKAAEQKLSSLKQTALTTNEALVKLRELEREAESNRAVYSSLLVRAKELAEQRRVDTTNSRVITEAIPPEKKSGFPPLLIIAGALSFGTVVGVGLALLREQFDVSIQAARQIPAEFGLRVLASLPAKRIDPSAYASGPGEPCGTNGGRELALCSPAAEQLRNLRDALVGVDHNNAARVVMLATLDQSDGASTVGYSLAAIAAADGDVVLLIDGGRQRVLKSSNLAGSSSLTKTADSGKSGLVNNVICTSEPTPEEHAVRIGNGGRGLRGRYQFLRDLISEQRGVFDLIVFDWSAPASDPIIRSFAALIDDVVIVVEAGRSRKDDLHRAIEVMRESQAPLRGVVLLGADDRSTT